MNVPLLEAGARQLDRVERDTRLDGVIAVLRRAVRRVVPPGPLADALHGTWLGHPLHPALTDVPIGAWLGAAVLDAVPGQEKAATALVGVGVAAAVPTALAGATDWSELEPEQQRLGLWHGLANAAATTAYAASLVARLRGRHGAGRALAGLGLAAAGIGAYLGGHLTYRAGAGFNHAEPSWRRLPEGWQPVDDLAKLPQGKLVRRHIGDVPVLVYRGPRTVHVLIEECAHLAGPLADGRVTLVGDEPCVVCPWHGSTYRLRDGQVRRGPATMPQPVLKVRVVDERVEARRP
ncbi:MAG: (2Fe-2S)-binding protein [Actinobacteria bacterium 13_2_20CM_2_72_6]|jgi:nitrite reductase/ring-hydroxylating ferredoxin subunit|nr:MAG: (2Fe-2S)-binding protein [Actinobacteria bacterium 13_2_20CM_2_72_6]